MPLLLGYDEGVVLENVEALPQTPVGTIGTPSQTLQGESIPLDPVIAMLRIALKY